MTLLSYQAQSLSYRIYSCIRLREAILASDSYYNTDHKFFTIYPKFMLISKIILKTLETHFKSSFKALLFKSVEFDTRFVVSIRKNSMNHLLSAGALDELPFSPAGTRKYTTLPIYNPDLSALTTSEALYLIESGKISFIPNDSILESSSELIT